MTDDPPPPFRVPPGGGWSAPGTPSGPPPAPGPVPAPEHPAPWTQPAMPPLGPPYAEQVEHPPSPRYPAEPPQQWPVTPLLPVSVAAPLPPHRPGWADDPRRRAMVWGGVAIVLAVIVGVLVGRSTNDSPLTVSAPVTVPEPTSSNTSSDTNSDSSSSERDTTTTTTEPQSLESIVLDIERFVERDRGLKFKHDVDVSLAADGEFQRLVLADFDKEKPAIIEQQQVLRAIGLVPPGFDLVEAERSFFSISVIGAYFPDTKRLIVRSAEITPLTREVLAHELTHALDDQWFDLNRPALDNPDDESGYAFSSLVEGNARRVENDYLASLSADEQDQAQSEQDDLILQHPEILDFPPIITTLNLSPYDDGPQFVQALLDDGGQPRLDAAFALPPITSEQILQPDRYLAAEGPVAVPAPKADGTPLNVGVMGELLLREMLFDSVPSVAEVQRAVKGWGGDSYVTWTDSAGRSCVRDTFVGDTPGDTKELAQAITEWGQDRDMVIDAPDGGPATFTVCT